MHFCRTPDGSQDADGDGYTNVEEFLNGTTPIADNLSGHTYTVWARGVQGTEEMALQIGGKTVANWVVSQSMQNYSYTGSETGTVRVAIINDQGVNHDLVVDKLTVDSMVYQAEAQAVNTGVWQNGCGGTESEWLHCSGYIEFDLESTNARQADQHHKRELTEPAAEVLVYPNPSATGVLVVQGIEAKSSQVTLSTLQGQDVPITQRVVGPRQLRLQPQVVVPGLYIIRVQAADGTTLQRRVVIAPASELPNN